MSKNKKWQKTLDELKISDTERQSVKDIMSRLRGNTQNENIDHSDHLQSPDHYLQTDLTNKIDHLDQVSDHKIEQITQTYQALIPKPLFTGNPVPIEPTSENPVLIDPGSNSSPLFQSLITFNQARGYKSLNILDDEIMPSLGAYEQIVLRRLYRLSFGFHKQTTDSVTLQTLSLRCNLSESTVKRALKSLVERKLIKVEINKTGERFGNRYHVLTGIIENPLLIEPRSIGTGSSQTYNKDHHDDLKKQDHHQNTTPTQNTISEHEKGVMTIYQKITGNNWTKADKANYEKVKHVGVDKIEVAIKAAMERAHNCPNSFAYFIKEILRVNNPPKQNLLHHKKSMQKIVDRVRSSFIGSTYSMSDFVYKVKDLCLREDLPFDNDLLDQILDRENRQK